MTEKTSEPEQCGDRHWDALHEISYTCNSRRGHAGDHWQIDMTGAKRTVAWPQRATP